MDKVIFILHALFLNHFKCYYTINIIQYELFTTYIDQNYATLSCKWTNTLDAQAPQAPEVHFFHMF